MNSKRLVFLLTLLVVCYFDVFSQNDEEKTIVHKVEETGGLVSYYFWEEDSIQTILNNLIDKPFILNYKIEKVKFQKHDETIPLYHLKNHVFHLAFEKTATNSIKKYEYKDSISNLKYLYPLQRELSEKQVNICFVKRNGVWEITEQKRVIYISIDSKNKWRFSHSSDSLIYKGNFFNSSGSFIVFRLLNESKQIINEQVYNYGGQNVEDLLNSKSTIKSQRYLLFVNGYRGPKRDKIETDHLVTSKDRFHYWFKLDNLYIDRLIPSKIYYLDGSMNIGTSNHRTFWSFSRSLILSTFVLRKQKAKDNFSRLNRNINLEGFQLRKERGRIAGKAFLAAICNVPGCNQIKDTIDIVCHSMGYAYTLGFIEEVKDKVIFRNIYIIAPENACAEGSDWSLFQQVWQYGSNLDQKNADPIWQQDGVAPQCQVKDLDSPKVKKGGRAFFPSDWPKRNFIDSHMVYNYYWIFDRIQKGENGFVE